MCKIGRDVGIMYHFDLITCSLGRDERSNKKMSEAASKIETFNGSITSTIRHPAVTLFGYSKIIEEDKFKF